MTVERVRHSGAYCICGTVNGHLLTRTYYGYTRRDAVALWRQYAREERAKAAAK